MERKNKSKEKETKSGRNAKQSTKSRGSKSVGRGKEGGRRRASKGSVRSKSGSRLGGGNRGISGRKRLPTKMYEGRIDYNANGYAFLVCEELEKDAFISLRSLNGAIHGDRVQASVTFKDDGKSDAVVEKIIEATERQVVGTYIVDMRDRAFVVSDDSKLPYDIEVVNASEVDAVTGDKVVVRITNREEFLSGKVIRVFKDDENVDWDIMTVILNHNLKDEFDEAVMREVAKIPDEISSEDIKERHDFRNELAITIDGDDSKDFDDAVSLIRVDGGYELTVHIADVAHYVRAGTKLDKSAFERGTSVYFPASFIPMLPEKICNNLCSLMENHDRLTLSVVMEITKSGKVKKHRITDGIIRSAHRMTYRQVESILNGDEQMCSKFSDVVDMLKLMKELALVLNKRRLDRGSVDFDLPESQITVDAKGRVLDIKRAARLTSHRIIEEFMLITNETVAEFMQNANSPFVYRGHLPPNDLKLESFTEFLSAMGIMWERGESVVPLDYSRLLASIPENLSGIVNMVALRSMTKAAYFPENKGHFGLASEFYCHFTAPIRRYPDLIIHRIIKDYLKNGKKCFSKYSEVVAEASTQSSLTERQADETEREVEDIYKARYMSERLGEEYDGIICGVTEWGIYVQLENTVEGLVRKEMLPDGNYAFNQVLMTLSNMSHIFRPGDKLRVKVLSTTKSKIDFALAGEDSCHEDANCHEESN